jgi:hypothetical protein
MCRFKRKDRTKENSESIHQILLLMPYFRIIQGVSVIATVIVLVVTGCSDKSKPSESSAASSDSMVIEPRVCVGKVRTNMTVEQVIAELGEPDNKTGHVLNYIRFGYSVVPTKDGLVKFVFCGDPATIDSPLVKAFAARTREGIGMTSSRAEVIKTYGPPTETELPPTGHEILRYKPLGLAFTLQDQKVHYISVNLGKTQ